MNRHPRAVVAACAALAWAGVVPARAQTSTVVTTPLPAGLRLSNEQTRCLGGRTSADAQLACLPQQTLVDHVVAQLLTAKAPPAVRTCLRDAMLRLPGPTFAELYRDFTATPDEHYGANASLMSRLRSAAPACTGGPDDAAAPRVAIGPDGAGLRARWNAAVADTAAPARQWTIPAGAPPTGTALSQRWAFVTLSADADATGHFVSVRVSFATPPALVTAEQALAVLVRVVDSRDRVAAVSARLQLGALLRSATGSRRATVGHVAYAAERSLSGALTLESRLVA